jgi:hypothetical protein
LLTVVAPLTVEVHLSDVDVEIFFVSSLATIALAADAVFTATDLFAVLPDSVHRVVTVGFGFVDLPALGVAADAVASKIDPVGIEVGVDGL